MSDPRGRHWRDVKAEDVSFWHQLNTWFGKAAVAALEDEFLKKPKRMAIRRRIKCLKLQIKHLEAEIKKI